ncbi:MAG: TRAP transporter small permease subunit [Pseudomonadota bacterium]
MALLHGLLRPIELWNDWVLGLGRWIAVICIALMVVCILLQVFFRYVLNNALPWPDEAARFLMLWMTGLIAPLAYRRGGFVSIDLALRLIPERLAALISLVLLVIAGFVLYWGIGIGYSEVTGFGGRFDTASLYVPLSLDFTEWYRVPRSWMFSSLFVGVILLFVVNLELILRSVITMLGEASRLRPIMGDDVVVE